MRRFACLTWVFSLCLIPSLAFAAVANIREEDADPDCFPWQLRVPNGSLTDNADATCSFLGASTALTVGSLTASGAAPFIRLTDSTPGEDDFEWYADKSSVYLTRITNGTILLQFDAIDRVLLPYLANCRDDLEVDAQGRVYCGTDATGAGGGDAITVNSSAATDANFLNGDIDWTLNTATSPDDITATVGCANCVDLTTETAGNYADGDAEAGAALTGDSATSFFSTGTLEVGIGGTGATSLTDGGILLGSGTGAITALGVATNGQIPIGDGTTDPVLATLTGTANQVTVTNGVGTITLSTPQDIATASSPTFADLLLSDGTPTIELRDTGTGAADFELWADNDTFYMGDLENSRQFLYYVAGNNAVYISSLNAAACDVKASAEGKLTCGTDATGGGAGSPAGTGSELQYRVDGSTFGAVTSSSVSGADVTLAGTVDLQAAVPTIIRTDTTASSDDYEDYVENNRWYFTNRTEGIVLWYINPNNDVVSGRTWDLRDATRLGLPTRLLSFPAASMEPLEAADAIPPLTKTTGTNLDEFSISYDATTNEGRKVTLTVPAEIDTAGRVLFRFYWWSVGQTTGNVRWEVRYTSTGADGEDWDQTLTTLGVTCAVAGNTEDFDICAVQETFSTLGWAVNDRITVHIYRSADSSLDTMTGDAELSMFQVIMPVS